VVGLAVGTLMLAILILRIFGDERMLRAKLAGYSEYARKVRCRLIPFIW